MIKQTLVAATLVLAVGCNDNPYNKVKKENLTAQRPQDKRAVPAGGSASYEKIMTFTEGTESRYKMRFTVPKGNPVLRFENLPDGAFFDKATSELVYTPKLDVTDSKKVFSFRDITIWVSSSANPSIATTYAATIKVRNKRMETKISFGTGNYDMISVNEGDKVSKKLKIESQEFPTGPFEVVIAGAPTNLDAKPDQNDPTIWTLEYTPDFSEILRTDSTACPSAWTCAIERDITITVIEPDGYKNPSLVKTLKVTDKRAKPIVYIPKKIEQGLNAEFQFIAIDKNNEVEPIVKVKGIGPVIGEIKIETSSFSNPNQKAVIARVMVSDIPPAKIGTTDTFRFNICVLNRYKRPNECYEHDTKVTYVDETRPFPIVARENWDTNEMVYLSLGEEFAKKLKVSVAEGEPQPVVETKETPASGNDVEALLTNPDEILVTIKANKAGPGQFALNVTSAYGLTSTQVFTYKVLPKDWYGTIYLGDSLTSSEFKSFSENSEKTNFINPQTQKLEHPLTEKRETVIIGTEVIKANLGDEFYKGVLANFKNVIIASPLIEDLPQIVKDEFEQHQVKIVGRLKASLPNTQFADINLFPSVESGLTKNTKEIKLLGKSSSESLDPAWIQKSSVSPCKEMLVLENMNDPNFFKRPVSVSCENDNGKSGKLIIMGTEWGEIKADSSESDLVKQWFKKLVE
ncbi:MAG: hypothetical protein ACPGJV_09020 [Bacteriovoracaceae bacterium]